MAGAFKNTHPPTGDVYRQSPSLHKVSIGCNLSRLHGQSILTSHIFVRPFHLSQDHETNKQSKGEESFDRDLYCQLYSYA